jgi:hypothetical protein
LLWYKIYGRYKCNRDLKRERYEKYVCGLDENGLKNNFIITKIVQNGSIRLNDSISKHYRLIIVFTRASTPVLFPKNCLAVITRAYIHGNLLPCAVCLPESIMGLL